MHSFSGFTLRTMATYVFDVGETLVSENRMWTRHADRLRIPTFTFFSVFGALLERGEDHRAVFRHFGVDIATYLADVDSLNDPNDAMLPVDLYPDVVPTLRALTEQGHRVGIAANQPARAQEAIEGLGLSLDFVGISATWGVSKPSPKFFARIIESANVPAHEIIYVGDRLDNDVLPSIAAGMRGVLIRRGPWGELHASSSQATRASRVIDALSDLV